MHAKIIPLPLARPVIALDGDGVLLDYHAAYAQAWESTFGVHPALTDTKAYWAADKWGVPRLQGAAFAAFRSSFDETFWSNLQALPGAVKACENLVEAGFDLVCVTALPSQYGRARLKNLKTLGFPIDQVMTTGSQIPHSVGTKDKRISPKAATLHRLKPMAFVEDYAPYLQGVSDSIHKALIVGQTNGSPNTKELSLCAQSQHDDLAAFAQWWIERRIAMGSTGNTRNRFKSIGARKPGPIQKTKNENDPTDQESRHDDPAHA